MARTNGGISDRAMDDERNNMIAKLHKVEEEYERIKHWLPIETQRVIKNRLEAWRRTVKITSEAKVETKVVMVMRPGLPPRPIPANYFTMVERS